MWPFKKKKKKKIPPNYGKMASDYINSATLVMVNHLGLSVTDFTIEVKRLEPDTNGWWWVQLEMTTPHHVIEVDSFWKHEALEWDTGENIFLFQSRFVQRYSEHEFSEAKDCWHDFILALHEGTLRPCFFTRLKRLRETYRGGDNW